MRAFFVHLVIVTLQLLFRGQDEFEKSVDGVTRAKRYVYV